MLECSGLLLRHAHTEQNPHDQMRVMIELEVYRDHWTGGMQPEYRSFQASDRRLHSWQGELAKSHSRRSEEIKRSLTFAIVSSHVEDIYVRNICMCSFCAVIHSGSLSRTPLKIRLCRTCFITADRTIDGESREHDGCR